MTKEQRLELRQLNAELRTVKRALRKVSADTAAELQRLNREHKKNTTTVQRNCHRAVKGIVKTEFALHRRIHILTGRLS